MDQDVTDDEVEESVADRDQVVLVVDDEADIRDSLQELFEGSIDNLRVLSAEGGKQALQYLADEPVDLIVTDYKMPGMNGLEFLAQARQVAPNVPRILMTAFPDLDLAIKSLNEENIENFFTKPLDPAKVVEIVSNVLHERRARELRNRAFARSIDLLRKRMQER